MTDEKKALLKVRDEIDAIDSELLSLFNQRAKCAEKVAEIKSTSNNDAWFYRPEREAQVLLGIEKLNQGPLSNDVVKQLIREIMSACLALEKPMRIAYLGPSGSFTQSAAIKQFGKFAKTIPVSLIGEIFKEVSSGNAHYGVVPIENSTEGGISSTLDSFINTDLNICGEVSLRIHHNLAVGQKTSDNKEAIVKIYSHSQSLGQCKHWLAQHYPNADLIPVSSNSLAAQMVAKEEGAAAVTTTDAISIYGLTMVAEKIEDATNNTTRFIIIGKQEVGASGKDKTSLVLSTKNAPGALYGMLEPLYRREISMTKIESRPNKDELWEYMFFIDIDGHKDDAQLKLALDELRDNSDYFRVLGSYPMACI
jgi:chorismate mutase/prephenate dehydratase